VRTCRAYIADEGGVIPWRAVIGSDWNDGRSVLLAYLLGRDEGDRLRDVLYWCRDACGNELLRVTGDDDFIDSVDCWARRWHGRRRGFDRWRRRLRWLQNLNRPRNEYPEAQARTGEQTIHRR
jgi:hypothetical protein